MTEHGTTTKAIAHTIRLVALASLLGACTMAWGAAPQAATSAAPPTERVFIGHVISTTLTTVAPSAAAPDGSIRLALTCAEAATTYDVLAGAAHMRERILVHSSLGEWCDMPEGMHGEPMLVVVTRKDGAWWEGDAMALEAMHDGLYMLVPARFPEARQTVCGVRLGALEAPLDAADQPTGGASALRPEQLSAMIDRHVARVSSDGELFFTAGIRWKKLVDALAETSCWMSAEN